jgi:predicted DNA-binding transcriptional regulator AlpA
MHVVAASDPPIGDLEPLLSYREAASALAISVPTFWRRVADGTVPKPVKFGRVSRWPRSEILEVIERAKDARGTSKGPGDVA